jgi:hypothetical protein
MVDGLASDGWLGAAKGVRYRAKVHPSDYRPRDAALVIVGGAAILIAMALVVFSSSPSSRDDLGDFGQALWIGLAISVVGAGCVAVGLVRAISQMPGNELPPVGLWGALAAVGVIGLILARAPLDWIGFYQPSDPRSQPSHVFGAILFFGSFATVFAVVGTVMLVSRLIRGGSTSRDIREQ